MRAEAQRNERERGRQRLAAKIGEKKVCKMGRIKWGEER